MDDNGVAADGFAGMGGATFNFNFDSTSFEFAVGGDSDEATGQDWNFEGPGVGFGSGSRFQLVTLDGVSITDSLVGADQSALQASVSAVPLPGAMGLLLAGLGLVSVIRMTGHRA